MKNKNLKIILEILLIFGILLPNFAYLQNQTATMPETLGEIKKIGERATGSIQKTIPEIFKRIWREEVLPIWEKIYNWLKKTFWDPYLGPFFQREIEKRKPVIEEEFKKEKVEMKESAKKEVPKATQSLWERFKELFK